VDGRIVAIFNVAGQFHALDGLCPHQGGPLGKGRLDGSMVTCPWHGRQFCVATGRSRGQTGICQARFPVRIEQDRILVDVAASSDSSCE
jgi:nitrite reductase/ring-hydroxylating ferredoxin subunit